MEDYFRREGILVLKYLKTNYLQPWAMNAKAPLWFLSSLKIIMPMSLCNLVP